MAKAISSDVRVELASVPRSYFAAVDRLDVDDVLSHFADDATLTVQTDGVTAVVRFLDRSRSRAALAPPADSIENATANAATPKTRRLRMDPIPAMTTPSARLRPEWE